MAKRLPKPPRLLLPGASGDGGGPCPGEAAGGGELLAEALRDFQHVLHELAQEPRRRRRLPSPELSRKQQRPGGGGAGSAWAGADSLYRNSFSLRDEKLDSPALPAPAAAASATAIHKAKLGDTKELEELIADLDRTLASM
ncbi:regulator of cell cycle RGCC [Heteronotia binoei]|uniref:regulator of cell cycle RGCC n=1 Tax=Heteronotia binoei TaxID=13085 RepID=UPI00292E846C|nr:regulator of cell cycle RGCC [Heteronotia binoei]